VNNFGGQPQQGNVGMAVLAGFVVAIACALVWGVIAYSTKYQFSLAAILVGLAVGTVMARIGRVRSPAFGIASAALAVFGCALGSLVAEMLVLLRGGATMSEITAHLHFVFHEYPKVVGGLGFLFWVFAALYGYRIGMGGAMRWGWRGRARATRQPYGMNQPYGVNQPYAPGQQPYGVPPPGGAAPPYGTPGQYGTPQPGYVAPPPGDAWGGQPDPQFGFKQQPPGPDQPQAPSR
jgi:hypothetical protein